MKDLNLIIKLLIIILIILSYEVSGQERFIGDVFTEAEAKELSSTKAIGNQKVTFVEKHFTIMVDKVELLSSLKKDAIQLDSNFKHVFGVAINYLNKTDNLVFNYVWTKADGFDDISWFEIEKLGERNLTKKLLKESLCTLIETGRFELYENEQRVEQYFFERIESNYGGNVKGIFSTSKRLIWICPPFIIN